MLIIYIPNTDANQRNGDANSPFFAHSIIDVKLYEHIAEHAYALCTVSIIWRYASSRALLLKRGQWEGAQVDITSASVTNWPRKEALTPFTEILSPHDSDNYTRKEKKKIVKVGTFKESLSKANVIDLKIFRLRSQNISGKTTVIFGNE